MSGMCFCTGACRDGRGCPAADPIPQAKIIVIVVDGERKEDPEVWPKKRRVVDKPKTDRTPHYPNKLYSLGTFA